MVIVRPGEPIVYGALNIDCAAKEGVTYKAAVKAKHKRDEAARLVRRDRACSVDCCKIRLGVALHKLSNCLTFLTPFLSKLSPGSPGRLTRFLNGESLWT